MNKRRRGDLEEEVGIELRWLSAGRSGAVVG